MRTITFYSYKGGVGRSLALAHTARSLAATQNVFVLDLDLEAPGLHFKLLDKEERTQAPAGFVEFIHEFLFGEGMPSIEAHVVTVKPTDPKDIGTLRLMTAGRAMQAEYWKTLTRLNWQSLFYVEGGEGVPFFLALKQLIEESSPTPDYLLIDARTGITEVGGIALTLLADQAVCLFVNNEESKWGTREILRSVPRATRPTHLAPVTLLPVLTRIPKPEAQGEEQEAKLLADVRKFLSDPVEGEEPPRIDKVFVMHSDRNMELSEQIIAIGPEPTVSATSGVFSRDFTILFREGLGLTDKTADREELAALQQEALLADDPSTAAQKWREALSLCQTLHGERSAEFSRCSIGLAKALRAQGSAANYRDAAKILSKILDDREALDSIDSFLGCRLSWESVLVSMELGETTDLARRLQQATSLFQKTTRDESEREAAVAFWTELQGWMNHRAVRNLSWFPVPYLELGQLLLKRQDWAKAEAQFEAIRTMMSERSDVATPELAQAQAELARLLIRKGSEDSIEKAIVLLEEARSFHATIHDIGRSGSPSSDSSELLRIRNDIADAQLLLSSRPVPEKRMIQVQAASRKHPSPPKLPDLQKRPRAVREGRDLSTFSVALEVVTPILGGAAQTRSIDEVDIIRVPSVRGHLRFWWRSLHAATFSPQELYSKEAQCWGGAGEGEGRRSSVEIQIDNIVAAEIDDTDIQPFARGGMPATKGAYALWPARSARGDNPQPWAPRRLAGTRFDLTVRCPATEEAAIRNVLRAWILFGGYGGRTRRGAGSLTVQPGAEQANWLPAAATHTALVTLFGTDPFMAIPGRALDDVAILQGAGLRVGKPNSAEAAWLTALQWLNDFRQAQPLTGPLNARSPAFARERGDNRRPGRSNWPESDKVRELTGRGPWAHVPRHNGTPAWPRAGFGLPIVSQFQRSDRTGARYPQREPESYEIRWRSFDPRTERWVDHDRLASPLVVKAMPLAGGAFAPCALWLFRGYPAGEVALKAKDPRAARSGAPFDVLVAPGDTAFFAPLAAANKQPAGSRLKAAFFSWLSGQPNVQVVIP